MTTVVRGDAPDYPAVKTQNTRLGSAYVPPAAEEVASTTAVTANPNHYPRTLATKATATRRGVRKQLGRSQFGSGG